MAILPVIRVGVTEGDLVGNDHRVLQAAVDYIAGLGGGTVKIGAGEYRMRDSLHLRSNVRVEGVGPGTILKMNHRKTTPAKIAGGRVGHRQGKPHRHGGINGVSTFLHDGRTCP